jgi:hypothetical protein
MFPVDATTPTGPSVLESTWAGGAARMRWIAASHGGSTLEVERCAGDGPWAPLRVIEIDATGLAVLEDASVERGMRYGYRLAVPGGAALPGTEAWIAVPAPTPLALERVGTNPGGPPLRFALSLPQPGTARLEILDVTGRVVQRHEWSGLAEGRQVVTVDGALAPGCYFARLRAAGGTVLRRFVALR